jgi:hypothetical protein
LSHSFLLSKKLSANDIDNRNDYQIQLQKEIVLICDLEWIVK